MGLVIATANQKGGVGKTITTTCMASLLTTEGKKILTISLDPQRNFDMVAGEDVLIRRRDTESLSMLHVMRGICTMEEAVIHTRLGDLVRASSQLYQWTGEQTISREEYLPIRDNLTALQKLLDTRVLSGGENMKVLDRLLDQVRSRYDYILIDTNPSLTLLTLNSLYASDYVIIPAFSETTSTEAITELFDTIQSIKYYNPGKYLEILGILMTRCDLRSIAFQRHIRKYAILADRIGTILFETKIRRCARATDYMESGYDLIRYDPRGRATSDYIQFVKELQNRIAEKEAERNAT